MLQPDLSRLTGRLLTPVALMLMKHRRRTALCAALSVISTCAMGCTRADRYDEPLPRTYAVARLTLSTDSFSDTVSGATVLPEFFAASNVRPLLGRFFVEGEYESVASPVVVLSHELWTKRFGAQPSIIGTRVRLDGREVTIVGVAPPEFGWPKGVSLWVPRSAR
jgi:hypothetical protein